MNMASLGPRITIGWVTVIGAPPIVVTNWAVFEFPPLLNAAPIQKAVSY